MKYTLNHKDSALSEVLQTADVGRLSLRDYAAARSRGESHDDAFEFVTHRFQRYNAKLIDGLFITEVTE